MKKIDKFDQSYKEYFNNDIIMIKIPIVLFLCIAFILMLIPAQVILSEVKSPIMIGLNMFYLGMVANYYMVPFMGRIDGKDQKQRMSIYKVLEYTPIDEEEIVKSRLRYLILFVRKLVIIGLVLQVLSSLLFTKSIHFLNVLLPLLYGAWMLFMGALVILPWSKRVWKKSLSKSNKLKK